MQVLFCDFNKTSVLVDMKKQPRHVPLMFYTLFISVKETGGKGSKILRTLFPTYIKENQF